MNKPQSKIDGANVLYWAWSGNKPFGWVGSETNPKAISIHGLVIAQYDNDSTIYRFSCNENWETEQDATYESTEEAMQFLPEQYQDLPVKWQSYEM